MTKISNLEITQIVPFINKVKDSVGNCASLEEAAQRTVDMVYNEYSDSLVLLRLYATVPFGRLPDFNRNFVTQLAQSNNISSQIRDNTMVLSLMGTRGIFPSWNDRRKSNGHVGIPLASATFIDQVPMMSRLLKEVGLDLSWIERQDSSMIIDAMGRVSGVFYVEDASTAIDHKNRKIIAAQDFVATHQVKTVFGLAGGYATNPVFITLIAFTREKMAKSQAALFKPLITNFKANTMKLASVNAFFKN